MKKMTENLKTIVFAIVLLFSTTSIFATDAKPSVKIVNAEDRIFTLIVNDAKLANITIRIFDEEGVNLLKENIAVDQKFSKAYDLSKLPKGIYEVELEDEVSFRKYYVMINSKSLEILEDSKGKRFKPVVNLKENFISLNLLNLGKDNIELSLTDESGVELYTETIENAVTIHKQFDLSKLKNGKYFVSVNVDGKYFRNEVLLKK